MADDLEAPTEETEPSLRDAIAEAFDTDAAAPAEGVQPHSPIPAEGPDGRVRDPATGQFVAKPVEQVQKSTPEPNAPEAPAESQPGTIRPPASWSATAKADFAKLPEHIQQEVLKREKDIEVGQAQWQSKGERLNRLDSVLAPRRELFQLAGIDEVQAVQALFAAQDYLERSPVEGIAYLARQYGVDLRQFAGMQPQGQAQQAPMPPVIQQLAAEVQSLKGALSQRDSQAQQAALNQFASQVEAFAADPKHLYFDNVAGDMVTLINSGAAKTLDEAYDRAVWMNPETRALSLREAESQRQAELQRQAKAKRYASGSVTGSPAPGSSPANSGPAPTLRDELLRNFAEAS